MNELKALHIFTKVVQLNSFSEASRQLSMSKSSVSKNIALLEKQLGVRLLNRTTQKLSLTEAGQIYFRYCEQITQLNDLALTSIQQYQTQPSGVLRISCPVAIGQTLLLPAIQAMQRVYPKLIVDLSLEDRVVNVVQENIDIAIRVGKLADSSLVAKKLCTTPAIVFTSAEYLRHHPKPTSPAELSHHNWIAMSLYAKPIRSPFTHKHSRHQEEAILNSSLKINSFSGIIDAVKLGLGISVAAKIIINSDIQRGELVPLLEDYELENIDIYAVFPHRIHLETKVRAFLDFLESYMVV